MVWAGVGWSAVRLSAARLLIIGGPVGVEGLRCYSDSIEIIGLGRKPKVTRRFLAAMQGRFMPAEAII